jgi:hypothetical protein
MSLSTHKNSQLCARRKGSGVDILVIDKTAIGAGASGITCGVMRNNYY